MEAKDKLELAEKILGIATKLCVFVGSIVLLSYCWSIKYFPKDISVGDGLLFIFVAVGFGAVYLIFAISITSFGILLRPVWHLFQKIGIWIGRIFCKVQRKTFTYSPFEMRPGGIEYFALALFGLLIVIDLSIKNVYSLPPLLLASFGCALLWNSSQSNDRIIDELSRISSPSEEEKNKLQKLRKTQPYLPIFVVAIALMVGGVYGDLAVRAMKVLHIRKDVATVHIKKPYSTLASESGANGLNSNFGEEYLRYPDSAVLLDGFGSKVVVSLKMSNGKTAQISIPSDHIMIIDR